MEPVASDLSSLNFRTMLRQSASEHTGLKGPGVCVCLLRGCGGRWQENGVCEIYQVNNRVTPHSPTSSLSLLFSLFVSLSLLWLHPISVTDTDRKAKREWDDVKLRNKVCLCACWDVAFTCWTTGCDSLTYTLVWTCKVTWPHLWSKNVESESWYGLGSGNDHCINSCRTQKS